MTEFHEGLKAEIKFWQNLIIESGLSIHSNEFKRMEYALLFAQTKLLKYEHESLSESISEPPKH